MLGRKQGLWGLSTSSLHLPEPPQMATGPEALTGKATQPRARAHTSLAGIKGEPGTQGLGQTCGTKPGVWAEPSATLQPQR